MTARELAAEILRLDREATPGPWTSDGDLSPDDVSVWAGNEFLANVDDPKRVPVAFDITAYDHIEGSTGPDASPANGRWIAAVRTLAVDLARAVMAAEPVGEVALTEEQVKACAMAGRAACEARYGDTDKDPAGWILSARLVLWGPEEQENFDPIFVRAVRAKAAEIASVPPTGSGSSGGSGG